jgi:tetratricopeptide (TPR) repeat protein
MPNGKYALYENFYLFFMKHYLFFSLVIIISTVFSLQKSLASQLIEKTDSIAKPMTHRDSIRERYLDSGALRYSLYSKERAKYIDSAIALSHDDASLWQQRGMPLMKQMKYEAGMPFIDSAVKYDSAMYLDYRAFLECIFSKQYLESLDDFRRAERRTPGANVMDHEYAFYMGLCYLQLCRYDSAEQCFRKCIADDQGVGGKWVHYMHTFYLGVTLYADERYASALEQFDKAILTYPNFSDAKYYKAWCLDNAGQIDSALICITQAERDIEDGFTINEDNAAYERYPYQIKKEWVKGSVAALQEESMALPKKSE